MSDGAKFQATNPDGSILSAAPPVAFGFMTPRPAAITVNGSTLGPLPGTLGLVAGPVSITGATLSAPAGTIHVTSAAGAGEVPVDPRNTPALTVTSFGMVAIKGGSTLDVSDLRRLGSGGSVFIRAGALTIDASEINGDNYGSGPGGVLSLRGDTQITLSNSANVHAVAMGSGSGADVLLSVASSGVILADAATVLTDSLGPGNGGSITIVAGQLTLQNGTNVLAQSSSSASGGAVAVTVGGSLTVDSGASLGTLAFADGNAGKVSVNATSIAIDMSVGASTSTLDGIGSLTMGAGNAGNVTLAAGALTIKSNGLLSSGQASQAVPTAGEAIALSGGGQVSSATAGSGNGGTVQVTAQGPLTLTDPGSGILALATSTASGNTGSVTVSAPQITLMTGAEIAITTAGAGAGGSINVTTPGPLQLDGAGVAGTQIAALATGLRSGPGGSMNIAANTLTIKGGAQIASSTAGPGKGGDVTVTVANGVTLSGVGPSGASGISTSAQPGSSGRAGEVVLTAGGSIALSGGAEVTSSTAGAGNSGTVRVTAQGPLNLTDPGSGILALATSTAGGNAGSVTVSAPQITLVTGAEIAITTAGAGADGSINVTTPGPLQLDGAGVAGTQIAALATGLRSGPGGSMNIAANTLTIKGGAQIASSTAGPDKGGDVTVTVANGVTLSGVGPSGASGISTSAQPGSSGRAGEVVLTAGGTIALSGGAEVTSSTAGTGNSGTVQVTAQGPLTLADVGTGIIASTEPGSSGNAGSVVVAASQITIGSGAEIASTTAGTGAGGSVTVTTRGAIVIAGIANTTIAASALGVQSGLGGSVMVNANSLSIGGTAPITTAGSRTGNDIAGAVANGATMPGAGPSDASGMTTSADSGGQAGEIALKAGGAVKAASSASGADNGGRAEALHEGCATKPSSSLVEAGRGGLSQDPESTLPALYIAGRDLNSNPQPGTDIVELSATPIHATARLTMRCGWSQ
jgi:hypothetical protein